MSNKNQQMKIVVVIVLVILLISSIIAVVRSSTSSTSVVKTEDVTTQLEDQGEEEEELELDEDMTVTTQAMAAKKELGKSMMMPRAPLGPPPDKAWKGPVPTKGGGGQGAPPVVMSTTQAQLNAPGIPFFTNPNGSVKGINQLTDEEYETLRKFYNRFGPDGYKHTDYPNRHKSRHISEKINFLKGKSILYSFLPGHEYSHNMNLSKGDNTFAERQQQLIQKDLTDEQILKWMDGWYRYSKKHKKIKLGGGQIVDEDDYQDMFPFYTLSINEIVNLVKDRKEQIEKDQKTRMNFHMYGFDDRKNQEVEGYRI